MLEFSRTAYTIVNDNGEIYCENPGQTRPSFHTIEFAHQWGYTIRVYDTEKRAKAYFLKNMRYEGATKEDFETGKYRVVKVTESYKEIE